MDKLENVGPEHLGILIVATVLVLTVMALWDWGAPLVSFCLGFVVNLSKKYYDKKEKPSGEPTTAKDTVAATATEGRNGIAIERNERNAELPSNGGNIVLRSRAEMIARMLKSETLYMPNGKGGYKRVGQVALIKLATGLDPTGRADSDYARLHAYLSPLMTRVEDRIIEK